MKETREERVKRLKAEYKKLQSKPKINPTQIGMERLLADILQVEESKK